MLRTGIIAVRYVHHRYINPWIIHSYKILRLERESHQSVPEGSVYVLESDENIGREKETNKVMTATNLFYNTSNSNQNNDEQIDEDDENIDATVSHLLNYLFSTTPKHTAKFLSPNHVIQSTSIK